MQVTRPTSRAAADVGGESDTSSLLDRLINPGEYEPVLPTTEEHTAADSQKTKSQTMKN